MSILRRLVSLSLLLAVGLSVNACSSVESGSQGSGSSFFSSIVGSDLTARHPRADGPAGGPGTGWGAREQVFLAAGLTTTAAGGSSPAAGSSSAEFNLNFENADLQEVVRAVLGNALAVNYTIDPNVVGTVTISSARPLTRQELLPALERVLQMNGAALVRSDDAYAVVLQEAAVAGWADIGTSTPGFGLSILPLRYISAETLTSLIEGFGTRPGSVRVETSQNLLLLLGSSTDRRAALETALSFDVDWMQDQSVGILPLRQAKPEAVIPELERIFKTEEGEIGADLVQFMPMTRLKAILVVAQQPGLLERARTWVQRLDSEDPGVDARVHVYRVKYREAQKLTNLLNQIFATGAVSTEAEVEELIEPEADIAFSERFGGVSPDEAFAEEEELGSTVAAGIAPAAGGGAIRISADTSNNSLVIYADQDARKEILAALAQIDVPQMQVAVNVTMAEIRLNDELRYGIQYFVKSGDIGLGRNNGSAGLFNTVANTIGRELPGFNFLIGSEESPDIIIDAFDSITDVQVLSSPSLVVLENETARFQVGDQIPIVTRTVTSVEDITAPLSNEVEYRDTGIILNVRPRIAENGVVSMEIEQEISSVSAGAATLTPTISNRRVSSSISIVDGQTVLLGGLISEQSSGDRTGIPGLNRLRGIGNLFGRKGRSKGRTELIILIRPSVIRGSQDAQHVAEELRSRMWGLGSTQAR